MDKLLEIKCALSPREKYECVFGQRGEKTKLGSYHGSYFWNVEGFGREKWVVTLMIGGVDIDSYLQEGFTEEEIVDRCLNFLNKPVGKRKKKRPYGNLEMLRTRTPSWEGGGTVPRFSIKEVEGGKRIVLLAVIDEKRNKNFWGKGHTVPGKFRVKF